jgi:hypothetical protein
MLSFSRGASILWLCSRCSIAELPSMLNRGARRAMDAVPSVTVEEHEVCARRPIARRLVDAIKLLDGGARSTALFRVQGANVESRRRRARFLLWFRGDPGRFLFRSARGRSNLARAGFLSSSAHETVDPRFRRLRCFFGIRNISVCTPSRQFTRWMSC